MSSDKAIIPECGDIKRELIKIFLKQHEHFHEHRTKHKPRFYGKVSVLWLQEFHLLKKMLLHKGFQKQDLLSDVAKRSGRTLGARLLGVLYPEDTDSLWELDKSLNLWMSQYLYLYYSNNATL